MLRLLMILLFFQFHFLWAEIIINGMVSSVDGKELQSAKVHLIEAGKYIKQSFKSIPINKDGSFEFSLVESRIYTFVFTAVDHIEQEIIFIPQEKVSEYTIDVELPYYDYLEEITDVKIIGSWNEFDFNTAEMMTLQNDGSFEYLAKFDSTYIKYQILGVTESKRSINGTMSDDFIHDGSGDYISVLKAVDGQAKIIFDLKKLVRNPDQQQLKMCFTDNTLLNQVNDISHTVDSVRSSYMKEYMLFSEKYGPDSLFIYDFNPIKTYLKERITGQDLLSRFSAVQMVKVTRKFDKDDVQLICKTVDITDPLWDMAEPVIVLMIYRDFFGEPYEDKIHQSFGQLGSRRLQAMYIINKAFIAKKSGKSDKVQEYRTLLRNNYSDLNMVNNYLSMLNPDKKIKSGNQIPEFSVKLLHSDQLVSRESLIGQYYLMDFWAVWCGPCRAEMPNLHEAYEKYKDKNFMILSLSFDAKEQDIDNYRSTKHPMPWLHTFVEKGFSSELAKRFDVIGVPEPILIGPDGKIIATESELRGKNLLLTLEKILNPSEQ